MKIQNTSTPVQSPPRTTKPATGTGKPKTESTPKPDAAAMVKEAELRKANDPAAQAAKKVQTVDVTG